MMKKPLALLGAFLLAGSVFAESEGDYIKTFGQLMYERNGMMELNLTPAELELFIQGMRDAQAGKPLPENIQQMGPKMFDYLRTRAEKNMKIAAEKSEAEAAAFWKELEKKTNVNKTPSGLAYEIVKEGDGKFPSENSDVKIKYTGKLINGKVFDSTDLHGGEPADDGKIEAGGHGLRHFDLADLFRHAHGLGEISFRDGYGIGTQGGKFRIKGGEADFGIGIRHGVTPLSDWTRLRSASFQGLPSTAGAG